MKIIISDHIFTIRKSRILKEYYVAISSNCKSFNKFYLDNNNTYDTIAIAIDAIFRYLYQDLNST